MAARRARGVSNEDDFAPQELALARALAECLDAMEAGERDVDRIVRRYPGASRRLKPLLEVAGELRRRRPKGAPLSAAFRKSLLRQLMTHETPARPRAHR